MHKDLYCTILCVKIIVVSLLTASLVNYSETVACKGVFKPSNNTKKNIN